MNFQLPKFGKRPRGISALQNQYYSRQHRNGYCGHIAALAEDWHPKTCQWLDGEPRERNFCCKPVKEGSSYCPEHHARCYTRVEWTPDAEKSAEHALDWIDRQRAHGIQNRKQRP